MHNNNATLRHNAPWQVAKPQARGGTNLCAKRDPFDERGRKHGVVARTYETGISSRTKTP